MEEEKPWNDGSTGLYTYADPAEVDGVASTGGTYAPQNCFPGPDCDNGLDTGIEAPGANGTAHMFHFTGTGFKPASYGGGMGIWLDCADAESAGATSIEYYFKGDHDVLVYLETPSTMQVANGGNCIGDDNTCVAPHYTQAASNAWVKTTLSWNDFVGGLSAGAPAEPDLTRIEHLRFAVVKTDAETAGTLDWGWDIAIDEVRWVGGDLPEIGNGGGSEASGGSPSNGGAAGGDFGSGGSP
jgi:hypothetical protein